MDLWIQFDLGSRNLLLSSFILRLTLPPLWATGGLFELFLHHFDMATSCSERYVTSWYREVLPSILLFS